MSLPVVVEETALDDQPPALLVRPADDAGPAPAVLWLHWLGHNRSDRTQFLPEALRLAQQGVVCLLPQGVFPWLEDPRGDSTDAEAVAAQARRTTTWPRCPASTATGSRWPRTTTARCSG